MDEIERRAEIARRLKAARWLAGGYRVKPGDDAYAPTALSAEELASREPLAANGISAYRIGTIERMEHHTPPMELDAIADALGVARRYFRPEDAQSVLPLTGDASPSEVADLLRRQSEVLERIEAATVRSTGAAQTLTDLVEQARKGLPPVLAQDPSAAGVEPGKSRSSNPSS